MAPPLRLHTQFFAQTFMHQILPALPVAMKLFLLFPEALDAAQGPNGKPSV